MEGHLLGLSVCLLRFGDGGGEGKIRAGVERRINVNQVYLASELLEQRGQDIFFVAPNKPVTPLRLAASGKEFQVSLPVLCAFVDRFDGLKGQSNPN